jgi:glycosyltransferase involved in cell wall biosynthesis
MALLSVVIITFNEERNIGRCLASVKSIADDIVVVDSFSTDATEAICAGFGVNFFKRPWDDYSSARNFGNGKARFDLVLTLDADESLSPELQRSIVAIKSTWNGESCKFARLTNYCGVWIRHGGWYPDSKVRIFDKKKTRWVGLLHADPEGIPKKDAALLRGDCYHHSYYSVAEHLKKSRRFAEIYARELFGLGKRASLLKLLFSPPIKFVRDYLLRAGFLDGPTGLYIGVISAWATYLKYANLYRLQAGKPAKGAAP